MLEGQQRLVPVVTSTSVTVPLCHTNFLSLHDVLGILGVLEEVAMLVREKQQKWGKDTLQLLSNCCVLR